MAQLKTKESLSCYRKYHPPGGSNIQTIKLNAIFIQNSLKKGYTKEHEQMKFDLAWEAKGNGENFLTEAARSATDEERELFKVKKDKIVDFVNLSQQQEYEIVNKHENHKEVAYYRRRGIVPIIVGETFVCKVCNYKFPKKNKKGVCDNCKNE